MLLCDLADEQFTCYPGREWIATHAELSERAVSSAVTQLVADGYLRVLRRARKRGGRTSNRYLVMVYGADTPLPEVDDWVSEFALGDDETPDQSNGAADAHMPDDDDCAAGHGNGDPAARMPETGNSDHGSRSTGNDVPGSNKEKIYPLVGNKEISQPPPTSHPDAPMITVAQSVLRTVTADIDVHRLPTDVERGRLVERVVELLGAGWDGEQLAARLAGMGPLSTVASVYAVLVSRLRCVGDPPPPVPSAVPSGPWCGSSSCDPTTRREVDADGRPRFTLAEGGVRVALWCPTCLGR